MNRTLSGWPNNHGQYQGSTQNSNQSETTQLFHNGIHSSSPNATSQFIQKDKTYINISHPPIQYNFNWTVVWQWMHYHVWQTHIHSKKTNCKYYWRLSGSNERVMDLPTTWSIPRQPTIKHYSKQYFQHIKPMALHHPIAYSPTFQQDLAIFYHHILFCSTKPTLSQAINDDSLSTWSGLTAKLITKYLPES